MVVHECTYAANEVAIAVEGLHDGTRIATDGNGHTLTARGGAFRDRFDGYRVRIYRWQEKAAKK